MFWTAGKRKKSLDWVWSLSARLEKPMKYDNWKRNEPNGAGDEDCVEVDPPLMGWNDRECTVKLAYICEKEY